MKEYLKLLEALQAADLLDRSELSVKPSDMGMELEGGGALRGRGAQGREAVTTPAPGSRIAPPGSGTEPNG